MATLARARCAVRIVMGCGVRCASSGWPAWATAVLPIPPADGTVPMLFCDGAARGNPGPGGAGAFLVDGDGAGVLAFQHCVVGETVTNNAAEYEVCGQAGN